MMDLRGNYTKCQTEKASVCQNPQDACYMLVFSVAEHDILPPAGQEIDLTFDVYVARARITAPSMTTKAIYSVCGQKVSSVHQLGSIMRLRHGDQVVLRRENGCRYSLHPV